jgi:hypothetical protein
MFPRANEGNRRSDPLAVVAIVVIIVLGMLTGYWVARVEGRRPQPVDASRR